MGRQLRGAAPSDPLDAATKGYVDTAVAGAGGGNTVTITYTGTSWPARTTVTVPSGGYAIYDSQQYPGAPQPSDWTGTDVWLQAVAVTPNLAQRMVAWFTAIASNTGLNGNGIALTAVGTATAEAVASTNIHTKQRRVGLLVTTAATSAVAGWREANAAYMVAQGFTFESRWGSASGAAAAATRRHFVGFTSVTAAGTDVNPSTIADCLGVGADAADTNLQFMHRTGSGTVVKSDTGIAKPTADATDMYDVQIVCAPGATTATMTLTRLSDGAAASYTTTTAIPASTTLLAPRGITSVGGTSSVVGFALSSIYTEVQ